MPTPASDNPAPTSPRADPRDTALWAGAALMGVGTVAAVVTLVPLLTGGEPFPLAAYLLALLAPVGLAVVLVALLQRARSRRRRLAATSPAAPPPVDAARSTERTR